MPYCFEFTFTFILVNKKKIIIKKMGREWRGRKEKKWSLQLPLDCV